MKSFPVTKWTATWCSYCLTLYSKTTSHMAQAAATTSLLLLIINWVTFRWKKTCYWFVCYNIMCHIGYQLSHHLHCSESRHCSAKVIKEESIWQSEEIIHKRCNGENKWELLILCTAICRNTNIRYTDKTKEDNYSDVQTLVTIFFKRLI